jgi:hypothetical protein
MSETLPDRLSVHPQSKFYDEQLLARGVGIRFNGAERQNVEEYCISEGWIRTSVGKTLDRRGQPLTIKLEGKVEPYLKDVAAAADPAATPAPAPDAKP